MKKLISTIKANAKSTGTKLAAIATAVVLSPVGVFASGIQSANWGGKTDLNALIGSIIGMMLAIAQYAGMGLTIWGVIKTIMAYKDDNTNEITQGIRLAVVGVVLVGLRTVLSSLGLIGN